MVTAYIGLGGNLGEAAETVQRGAEALNRHPDIERMVLSSLYGSKPMGPQDQPDYVNGVARVETTCSPLVLLDLLQEIENAYGRVRDPNKHWGERTLDLDLLLYGDEVIDHPRLQVPHPWLTRRNFVVIPLHEIEPQLILPSGEHLEDCLALLGDEGIWKL